MSAWKQCFLADWSISQWGNYIDNIAVALNDRKIIEMELIWNEMFVVDRYAIPVFICRNWGQSWQTWLKVAYMPTEIVSKHFPDVSWECYR
jgi:hypothetical protein